MPSLPPFRADSGEVSASPTPSVETRRPSCGRGGVPMPSTMCSGEGSVNIEELSILFQILQFLNSSATSSTAHRNDRFLLQQCLLQQRQHATPSKTKTKPSSKPQSPTVHSVTLTLHPCAQASVSLPNLQASPALRVSGAKSAAGATLLYPTQPTQPTNHTMVVAYAQQLAHYTHQHIHKNP